MRPIVLKLVISILIFSFQTSGCKRTIEPASIGSNLWPGYEPLYLAEKLGYFGNSRIRFAEAVSASQVSHEFARRKIDFACLTLDEAIRLHDAGHDFRVIIVLDVSNGADALIAREYIDGPGSLAGKRIGLENSALGAFFLTRFLELNNLKIQNVSLVSSEEHEHEDMFLNGKVDAIVTFEPVTSRLLKKSRGKILFDSRSLPDEIIDVLVVQEELYKSSPDVVMNVKTGWFKAIDYFYTHRKQAMAIFNERLKMEDTEVAKMFEGLVLGTREVNEKFLSGNEPLILGHAMKLQTVMKNNGMIRNFSDMRQEFRQ